MSKRHRPHPDMKAYPDESVFRLKLECLLSVVDETETSAASTTELRPESEDDNLVLVRLVHLG